MEYLFIYCLQMFDCLKGVMFLFGVCFIITIIAAIFCYIDSICNDYNKAEQETIKNVTKTLKNFSIAFGCLWFLLLFVPTKETLLLMGGMYLGKKAVNAIVTDQKLKKVNEIIELELDKRIKELKAVNNG